MTLQNILFLCGRQESQSKNQVAERLGATPLTTNDVAAPFALAMSLQVEGYRIQAPPTVPSCAPKEVTPSLGNELVLVGTGMGLQLIAACGGT